MRAGSSRFGVACVGKEQAGASGGKAPLAGLAARFREVSLPRVPLATNPSLVAGLGTSPRWSPGDLLCTSPAEEQAGPISPPPAVGESVAPAPVIPAKDSGVDVGAAATVPAATAPKNAMAAAADAAETYGEPKAEAGASCHKVCVCVFHKDTDCMPVALCLSCLMACVCMERMPIGVHVHELQTSPVLAAAKAKHACIPTHRAGHAQQQSNAHTSTSIRSSEQTQARAATRFVT